MREARRASQRSANYLRKSARVANPRAFSERNVNREVELGQLLIAASAAIRVRTSARISASRRGSYRSPRTVPSDEMLERIATHRTAPRTDHQRLSPARQR